METTRRHKYQPRSACKSTEAVFYPERKRRRRRTRTPPQLPEDVVREILLRLPVKSLVRFNCVCKPWYDLIRSPNFIAAHYKITSLKKKASIFYCDDDHHSYSHSSPFTVSFRISDVRVKLTIPARSQPLLVGCYKGLVCLCLSRRRHHEFLLWNPATTQSRIIRITCLNRIKYRQYYSGLCFDSAANTHKIVRIRFFLEDNKKFGNITVPEGKAYVIAYVYTLNKDSWRMKKLFAPCRLPNGGHMSEVTHLMKFMCWMVFGGSGGDKDKYILCLNTVDMVFKLIELPCGRHIHCCTKLVDYKGSLAMFVFERPAAPIGSPPRHCCFDMWVLNDCGGTNQSWCKQLTLRPPMSDVYWPLGFFTKGDVDFVILFMSNPGRYILWNQDTDETNNVIFGKNWPRPSFLYSESFASVYR